MFQKGDEVYYNRVPFGGQRARRRYGVVNKVDKDLCWGAWDDTLEGARKKFNTPGHFMTNVEMDKVFAYTPKPAPAPAPVSFVFIDEGKMFRRVDVDTHNSLEDAHKRCLELRKAYKTEKIFSYVRVE